MTNELFLEWQKLLSQHRKQLQAPPIARDVYKGGLWNAYTEAFNKINEPRKLWITSCGYGFINSEEKASGYNATFKSREEDSLYNKNLFPNLKQAEVKKQWWDLLTGKGIVETNNPKSIHELVNSSKSNDIVLIAAGSDYYEALYNDLSKINISASLPKIALVGIKRLNGGFEPSIPKSLEPYIQSYSNGRKLQKFLDCAGIQVQAKSASYLIEVYNKTGKLEFLFP